MTDVLVLRRWADEHNVIGDTFHHMEWSLAYNSRATATWFTKANATGAFVDYSCSHASRITSSCAVNKITKTKRLDLADIVLRLQDPIRPT
jgi:hypothetical protein